ncbi:MAG: hypothetical protein HY951_15840 [Bacteroidia bacterium]|nr:hypothetical protein [Bacteroidia bacterium]
MKYKILFLFIVVTNISFSQNSEKLNFHSKYNDSLFNKLPVYNINTAIKLFPNTFLFYKNSMLLNNMESLDNSIYLDDIPIIMHTDFPIIIINNITFTKNCSQANSGNSINGNFRLNTLQPSDSINYTFNLRKDIPNFYSNVKNDKYPNIIEGSLEIDGTIKLFEKFKPKYLLALSFKNDEEPNPTNVNKNYLNTDKQTEIYTNPLNNSVNFPFSSYSADYLSSDNFYKSRFIKNDNIKSKIVYAKVLLPLSKSTFVTIGNYSVYKNGNSPVYENLLMNSSNNPDYKEYYTTSYIKFEQNLYKYENINIKYNINASYSLHKKVIENKEFKKDFFRYGYAGKFKTYTTESYSWTDTLPGFSTGVFQQDGFRDTLITFNSNNFSIPFYTSWNNSFFNIYQSVQIYNNNSFQAFGGLLNGDEPSRVYNLWNLPGLPNNTYSEKAENNWYLAGNFNFDFKNIMIEIGGDFSKMISRNYNILPNRLWTLARASTNYHIQELNTSIPHLLYDENWVFQDTISYDRLYNPTLQTFFDYNLRLNLGKPYNNTEYLYIDDYLPSDFSIEMFSADDVLANNIVQTYGYDFTGKISKNNYSDFFSKTNDYGLHTRPTSAFEPINYNVFFNSKYKKKNYDIELGIKLNAYNSNQPVVEDPYSFYKIRKASEVTSINGNNVTHPNNIGNNYAVYVDNFISPTQILAYRDGNNWYNNNGQTIEVASNLAQPYFANFDFNSPSFYSDNFSKYKTAYKILPFFQVNYYFKNYMFNIKYYSNSRNPGFESIFNPINYLAIYSHQNDLFTNSALKPMYSKYFEAGISNIIGKRTKIGLNYQQNWTQNIFDICRYERGVPFSFFSYYNNPNTLKTRGVTLDITTYQIFNTGFNFGGSVCIQEHRENTKYYNLFFPKTIAKSWIIYSVDNSHHGNTNFYKKFSKHLSFSILFDYRQMVTDVNHLPYFYYKDNVLRAGKNNQNFSVHIQKSFFSNYSKYIVTIYAIIENILNKKNFIYYYNSSGTPEDDGYLANPYNQISINSQNNPAAFRNYYSNYINNSYNYDIPRIFRFGIKIGL